MFGIRCSRAVEALGFATLLVFDSWRSRLALPKATGEIILTMKPQPPLMQAKHWGILLYFAAVSLGELRRIACFRNFSCHRCLRCLGRCLLI